MLFRSLRKRLFYVGIVIIILFVVCYWQNAYIQAFVTRPISPHLSDHAKLIAATPLEAFVTQLKMCFLASLVIGMPFILWQFWRFIAPGLYKQERRYLLGFVITASFLFLAGAMFVYSMVLPLGMRFMIRIGVDMQVESLFTVSSYLTLVLKLMIAFGSVFELPVVVYFLAKIGLVNADMLRKYRRFAIVGIFILAAVLTPPDVISQVAMAIPLLILYEISIFIAKKVAPKKTQEDNSAAADIYQ